eukprot:scaffold61535_cov62-Phaeocystis_antarctica.AAC.3
MQRPVSHSQFAWRRRAARSREARRHKGHDVSGGALARGSLLEEHLVRVGVRARVRVMVRVRVGVRVGVRVRVKVRARVRVR